MCRRAVAVEILTILTVFGGIMSGCRGPSAHDFQPMRAQPTVSLLFDRFAAPQAIPASAFTAREAWPSADGGYDLGESISYQELFVDHQGPQNFGFSDQSYRRVRVRREGAIQR